MNGFENNIGMEIDGLEEIEMENTSVDEIDSENINLIFLGIDQSGSMDAFRSDMKHSLAEFRDALKDSREAEEILVARADFEDKITVGGYKKIGEFDTSFSAGGCTAMYDAVTEGTRRLREYRQYLKDQGVRVNAVVISSSLRKSTHFFASPKLLLEAKDLGFRNILDVTSSASELRKAFDCLSKSVIESSKSVVADGEDFFQI